ncbi:cob(I)yrinic acid a,c-diamide adenosyltransferase [Aerococcus urinae]|uniref:cob(I)yrinic acid a,c-diamide adenosyltransferase n=1 Tax=Aerococcus urinae TaxID=1376 RepID=UPI00254AE0F8|nr:cob(I)yrinic acid a,c-diamide adenosyltransferase [Aerococcus urinae]MDK6375694.1 cob(I)yrinic acid a,c-diamide adenosyltransferase [Aerococcus urinae]MDK6420836.1 cob(I)yrinic acid a,c-diamide adenosyltransferase [Aerococcus urinae]MDK8074588.1 cob(I)yrinic acid a,c-diamide adenosyltransferase [Aerococcus urinae]MDK8084017.1 cob(I)yrinic acid a,c-diamide adenosyltransferase [Aerococcus urinae]
MAIYTRSGDQGMTRLYGGHSVSKASERVGTYGAIDQLNASVGYLADLVDPKYDQVQSQLLAIQQDLFDCGSDYATLDQERPYKVKSGLADKLEAWIDDYTEATPSIKKFVLPRGTQAASFCHMLRTQTRTLERQLVQFSQVSQDYNPQVLPYINRLSDYFFSLARALNHYENYREVPYKNSRNIFSQASPETKES